MGSATKGQDYKTSVARLPGKLEHEVLEALWDKGPLAGKEVFEHIRVERSIALTTVLTVLERLMKKGLVKRQRGVGGVNVFSATQCKDEFARSLSGGFLRNVFEISSTGAVASFVDMLADVDPGELDALSSMIEAKKKEISGGKR